MNINTKVVNNICTCNIITRRTADDFSCESACLFNFSRAKNAESEWLKIVKIRDVYYLEPLSRWAHLMEEIIYSQVNLTAPDVIKTSFQANIYGNRGFIYDNMLSDLLVVWEHRKKLEIVVNQDIYKNFWLKSEKEISNILES